MEVDMADHEFVTGRDEDIDTLAAWLKTLPEDSNISVSVQYVPLRYVRESDTRKIIFPETDEAFQTAKRQIGSKIDVTLFLK